MSHNTMPSALRDWQDQPVRPQVLVVRLGVGVVLGLSGPFDTRRTLAQPPCPPCWTLVLGLTDATGLVLTGRVMPHVATQPRLPLGFGVVLMIRLVIKAPAPLVRLPLEKRGRPVAISVQHHCVNVVTTRGLDMLLMRNGDAIHETAPVPRLRVHRSHRVALDQIAAVRRSGGDARLTLRHRDVVPFGRSVMPAWHSAGLPPRRVDASYG